MGRIGYTEPNELAITAPDTFVREGVKLFFKRDADGAVTGFEIDAGRVTGIRFVRR
jgi:hypothetical protein